MRLLLHILDALHALGGSARAQPGVDERIEVAVQDRLGLAPILVDQILNAVQGLRRTGLTVLLVEQNARAALSIADRAYVMETGKVTLSGAAAEIQADHRVREAYLGI